MRNLLVFLVAVMAIGCGPEGRNNSGDIDAAVPECSDGVHRCLGTTYQACVTGTWVNALECAVACEPTLGCVECIPGTLSCENGDVHMCGADGNNGPIVEACTGANVCESGVCVDACANAAMNRSYTGCEYFAVDLDNAVEVLGAPETDFGFGCLLVGGNEMTVQACFSAARDATAGTCDQPGNTCPSGFTCQTATACGLDAQHSPFAIVVSNPQARSVDVTVTGPGGQMFTQAVGAGQVTPLLPQQHGIPDQSIDHTGKARKAYKVTSTLPIVAYQFNPLENVDVFSNDASLLVPRTAWDIDYYAMSWQSELRRPESSDYYGYITIVAYKDNTVIEVTPTAAILASSTQVSLPAGAPVQFTLNAFDTLNLQAVTPGDLTGTKITSVDGTTAYGVFGGQEAMYHGSTTPPDSSHTAGPCCADHVEEMLFPTSTWGKSFAVARSSQRSNETDVLRIMAQKPGTTISFDPAPVMGTCGTLEPGQFCQVEINVDTAVSATEPVLVGHYLTSAIWQNPLTGESVGSGDPSMAIVVPAEQYRREYTILAPAQYTTNWISISAPATGAVLVDGQAQSMTAFGNNSYRASRVMVSPGQHKITCPDGCGVEVYGYSNAVSYLFAGGLDLRQIVIN